MQIFSAIFIMIATFVALNCTPQESESLVHMTRPGGMALDPTMKLLVGSIYGDQWRAFREDLQTGLRKNFGGNMYEREMTQEEVTDSALTAVAVELGKEHRSLVIISGRYKVDHREQTSKETDAFGREQEVTKHTTIGSCSFTLTDLTTKALSFSRTVGREESFSDGRIRELVVDALLYELHPYKETYEVKMFMDSRMPELQSGISSANGGNLDHAIEIFESVPGKYPTSENLHMAYYDLGISYKWKNMFSEARVNLEKAYSLHQTSDYQYEIKALSEHEREYLRRLKEVQQEDKK